MMWSRGAVIASVAVLLATWGCGGTPTSSTPTTYEQHTETYTGTLGPSETKAFHFTVTNPGSLDGYISALAPVATLTMGLQFGVWNATDQTCSKSIFSDSAGLNLALSATPQAAGEYCVAIYDVGNVQDPTDFTITLLHY